MLCQRGTQADIGRMVGEYTCAKGQERDEGDGVGGKAPVERAGRWVVDVGHGHGLLR